MSWAEDRTYSRSKTYEYHCKLINYEKAGNKRFNEYDALIKDQAPNKLCIALQQGVSGLEEKRESLM